jgi:hypothetical protein
MWFFRRAVKKIPTYNLGPGGEFYANTVEYVAREKAEGREVGLPLSTEDLARQLKAKGYRVTLEM